MSNQALTQEILSSSLRGFLQGSGRLSFTVRINDPSKLACDFFREGGLIDLPLRASNEDLLRPRVALSFSVPSMGGVWWVLTCAQLSPPPTPGTPRRAVVPCEGSLRPRVAGAQGIASPSSPQPMVLAGSAVRVRIPFLPNSLP
jgi:hypothetical protein